MAFPDIFSKAETDKMIERVDRLTPAATPQWGKMNVAQMLAHCNVAYEMAYDNIHRKPNALVKLVLKLLVKGQVVSEKPYPKSMHTAPQFIVTDEKDFLKEQQRLKDYLRKTQELGAAHFDGKESHSFGRMNRAEWNNLFYKHLDHHLVQFGV